MGSSSRAATEEEEEATTAAPSSRYPSPAQRPEDKGGDKEEAASFLGGENDAPAAAATDRSASTSSNSNSTNGTTTRGAEEGSTANGNNSNKPKEEEEATRAPPPPRDDARRLRASDLLRLRPWVLVPEGSMNGYFDYLPKSWRVGPWNPAAVLYLLALASAVFLLPAAIARRAARAGVEAYGNDRSRPLDFSSYLASLRDVDYGRWRGGGGGDGDGGRARLAALYNSLAFAYMSWIAVHLKRSSPLGVQIWSTYTIQSWTLLALRHLCCALACLVPPPAASGSSGSSHVDLRGVFAALAELARFPAAGSAAVTFAVWNALVMPFIYLRFRGDPDRRRGFLRFCFSFRLLNVHGLNIVLAYWNVVRASPPRLLGVWDFYWALVSVALYVLFYLLVLDRLGVHLYAVFSPRAPARVVLATWTVLLGVYASAFLAWQRATTPSSPNRLPLVS